jgi:Tfp pilus assembly protein PilO
MMDWFILAATSWPDAAIAIFGIVLVMVVVSVAIWQVFGTGKTAIASKSAAEYRTLAEESAATQRRTAQALERLSTDVGELRERTAALEKLLKEVG